MVYNPHSADLLTVGDGNEIFRLNLSLGRFQAPLVSACSELNCADYSPALDLLAVGGVGGSPEFWDLSSKSKAHTLKLPESVKDQDITSIRFEPSSALQVAVGTEKGKVLVYDMRYPMPVYTLSHHYRMPINSIKFHTASRKILTADKKIVKLWNQTDGSLFTNIEPKVQVNDVEIGPDGSGMLFVPME